MYDCYGMSGSDKHYLAKHNLFTGQDQLMLSSFSQISHYYVSNDKVIASFSKGKNSSNNVYWNGNLVKGCHFSFFKLLRTADDDYITDGRGTFYSRTGAKYIFNFNHDVSPNGKRMIYIDRYGRRYVFDVRKWSLKDIFGYIQRLSEECDEVPQWLCHFGIPYEKCYVNAKWFYDDSEHLLEDCFFYPKWIDDDYLLVNNNIVVDLEIRSKMEVENITEDKPIYIVKGRLLVVFNYRWYNDDDYLSYMRIYDINAKMFLTEIEFDRTIVIEYYNKNMDVFVTFDRECYRLTKYGNEFKIEKVRIGSNYISDMGIVPKSVDKIMYVVLNDDVLFDLLPFEILNIDLYQQLLHVIGY